MRSRWHTLPSSLLAGLRAHPWNVLGCALAMLYGIPTAWYPFGSDQGIHWYLGHRLLGGDMPYASGVSGKPPVIFLIHAIAETLFGNRQSSIRILEILAIPGFGYLIAKGLRRPEVPARDGEVGAAALLLSAANFTYQDYWNLAHPEFYMTLALSGALVVAMHETRPRRRGWLAGALCMIAFLLKYPGAAIAIPIAACCGFRALYTDRLAPGETLTWKPSGAGLLALLRQAGWFLLGAAVVFGLCILPFALTGTMREMIEVCVLMTENYAYEAEFPFPWYQPLFDPLQQAPLYVSFSVLFLAGIALCLHRRSWKELAVAGLAAALAVGSIASVVLQMRLFNYHWIATYASFVGLAVWGLRQLVVRVPPRVSAPLLLTAALVWTVGSFLYEPHFITKVPNTYREHVARWWSEVSGEVPPDTLRLGYHRKAQADKFGDLVRASDEVRRRARPGDTVCLTCFISPIYQLTGMHCNTRHAVGTFTLQGPRSWVHELNQHLREDPPRFMVSIRAYPRRNKQLVNNGYREVARYGTVMVFEHLGRPADRGQAKPADVAPKLPRTRP